MSSSGGGGSAGGNHLVRRNELMKEREQFPEFALYKTILLVEDEAFDGDKVRGTLNAFFNHGVEIRRAATLGSSIDSIMEKMPDLVFLDDYLRPSDNATVTIPFMRRAGFEGPIIVVSTEMTRQRRGMLIRAGAADAIHKDDLESVSLGETLRKVILKARSAKAGEAAEPDGSGKAP